MTDSLFFIDEDEVLAHHGVKGMKWGVRKQRAASGGAGSTKKRKGLSRKQKAAIAGVLGTAAAAGAGYYLHKSGKGKKLAALAKKGGASAKRYAQGKGGNLGTQARAKAKGAAGKLKTTKAGKYAEAARLSANAAGFKAANAARGAGYKAKNQARKASNKARKAAQGAPGGLKSAAGSAARSAKSAASKLSKKTPGKELSTQVRSGGVGRVKPAIGKVKVIRNKNPRATFRNLAIAGAGAKVAGLAAGKAGAKAAERKIANGGKGGSSRKRRR